VGRNLGAGMSGGECFVFDPDGMLERRLNPGLPPPARPTGSQLDRVRGLLVRHRELTGSRLASTILAMWGQAAGAFRLVAPALGVGAVPPSPAPRRAPAGRTADPALQTEPAVR